MKLSIKNRPLKISHSYEYTFDNKYAKITLSKHSLLFPVFNERQNKQIGFLIDGPIGLIADLLVHSDDGAVGEIIEETYSHILVFPIDPPFLSLDHVKEIKPVENMSPYEEIIRNFKFNFIGSIDNSQTKSKGVLIHTLKKGAMWFIGPRTTYFISPTEIIGRRGEGQLFWLSKREILVVKRNGKIKRLSDVFSIKKARKHFDQNIRVPLNQAFCNFRDIFTQF
ncbi:MAG: hypothetical protein KAS63_04375 [Candidatus Heimdallarchaeota archaeon]|nr:hypothetical protein [Candidatus Heimdallarchaeota archaeon]MCK4954570.1 hypothetical protein [Candidatus Heimdallarchaeota archaeon]